MAATALPGRVVHGIASLPDRGQLVAFRRDAEPRRTLAYTWRPIDISEAHALDAIGGELVVTAPDGQPIRLRYEQHVEHPDGNWTWIGRPSGNPSGEEAIITFGEKAVFGSIPHGKGPALQITTGGGRLWMMETDPRAVASLPGAHPGGTDALLPPIRSLRGGASVRHAAGLRAVAASTGAPVVDVLLGYTSGFATRLGGQSQANTRLVNLVDIANQAYANSQVAGRIRLVKTMQVSYPDATSNESALYALTGCNTTACTQVDPALQPLHDARDKYGADAISLVRNYNDPENGNCGIAWLLGGGQVTIQPSDEYAAMSVVSDSNGIASGSFPDNGYVCYNETLAHELGHNMGLAHDRDTADGDDNVLQPDEYGRYPYSFGYKNTLNAFFTVMAYGDSGQHLYRVFSNPQSTYCGTLACGITDQADNARTLRLTMLDVSAFRSPVAMRRTDFDADGFSDIFWRNARDGRNTVWLSANSATAQATATLANMDWSIVGSGDFDGDGRTDIFWRNLRDGRNSLWRSGSAATSLALTTLANMDWKVVGIGDFNGDYEADVFWHNARDGRNTIWYSANSATSQALATVNNAAWVVAATGDFDADGNVDVLWRNMVDGRNTIWRSGDSSTQQAITTLSNMDWKVAGAGDFDGDGAADILWRNGRDGRNSLWKSANSVTGQTLAAIVNLDWVVAAIGDFNGDGVADILWHNRRDGRNTIWKSGNAATPQAVATIANLDWVVSG